MNDTAFHLGAELTRAVNRMDFFRLYKAMTLAHGYSAFALCDLPAEADEFTYKRYIVLHSLPDEVLNQLDDGAPEKGADGIVDHVTKSVVPVILEKAQSHSPLAKATASETVAAIPLHTPSGRRHALILFGGPEAVTSSSIAVMGLEASLIFQRYFEALLSLETITGLSERELQIVQWTSEGKTSADIAVILGLSEHTVNSYTAAILRKLNVGNRAQMVATAIRSGLIG